MQWSTTNRISLNCVRKSAKPNKLFDDEHLLKHALSSKHRHTVMRRIVTENNQKKLDNGPQTRKVFRNFELPHKSLSPKLKKIDCNDKKIFLCSMKKNRASHNTNQVPILYKKVKQKVSQKRNYKNKPKQEQHIKKDKFQQNIILKNKSAVNILHKKSQLNGTVDCTHSSYGQNDIKLVGFIGQGTFGKVYKGYVHHNGRMVAMKRVYQDPKFKNREVQIVKQLQNPYVMQILNVFETTDSNGSHYINIVMQHYQNDLYHHIKGSSQNLFQTKLISYQILRGLMYIHSMGICHRDIKPHNILIKQQKVVLCDFGSAKILNQQPSISYICSRCYRAPQLLFGSTQYNTKIDMWSAGCVILEILYGQPLFIANNTLDHLIQIIKIIGTPTKTNVAQMNSDYDLTKYKLPKVKKKNWRQVIPKADSLFADLMNKIMVYCPNSRLSAGEALSHEFFDELRTQYMDSKLRNQYGLNLLSFSEKQLLGSQHLRYKLIPKWCR